MKPSNIKLSRTFSIVVIVIAISVFLLPSLSLKIRELAGLQREERMMADYKKQLDDRINNVRHSIEALGISDDRLRRCVDREAMKFARVHPDNSGGIDSVQELETLRCPRWGIKDLSGLENAGGLENLYLEDNQIADIGSLAGLTRLKKLNLEDNRITVLEPLQNLVALETLRLSGNRTLSADVLLSLPNLETVSLPRIAHIFCRDLERLASQSCFEVVNTPGYHDCKGEYSNRVAQLQTKQRLGGTLTLDEEAEVLEYDINQMKNVSARTCE